MEHRLGKRLQKAIKVTLYHYRLPVVICKTRDVGTEGLFVECGFLDYKNNTLLEVEFEGTSSNKRRRYRVSAITVHFSKQGMGLFIRDHDCEAVQAWREMVRRVDLQQTVKESKLNPLSVAAGP